MIVFNAASLVRPIPPPPTPPFALLFSRFPSQSFLHFSSSPLLLLTFLLTPRFFPSHSSLPTPSSFLLALSVCHYFRFRRFFQLPSRAYMFLSAFRSIWKYSYWFCAVFICIVFLPQGFMLNRKKWIFDLFSLFGGNLCKKFFSTIKMYVYFPHYYKRADCCSYCGIFLRVDIAVVILMIFLFSLKKFAGLFIEKLIS